MSEADRRDIAAVTAGDPQAYSRLVSRYQNEIARYMWRFTRSEAVCEELVHDTFVEAYFGLATFRGDAPFLHWLRKLATRVGYHHWKAMARERTHRLALREMVATVSEASASSQDEQARADLLHGLLAQLQPRDRLVLTLQYLEELSTREVAEITGWSHALVRVQAHRARARLKSLAEKQLGSSHHV